MFEGLRDRRSNRPQEASSTAQAAAAALARRQMRQPAQPLDGATGPEPGASTAQPKDGTSVAGQQAMVARHATAAHKTSPEGHDEADAAGQTLTVGAGIQLKGEITNCRTLIVEGHVEGSAASGMLQIAEGGAFVGEATIDTAVVSGHFEGSLTAARRLVIRASGRVSGTIRYAAIAIEAGGQISGDVQVTASDAAAVPAQEKSTSASSAVAGKTTQIDIAS